MRSILVPIEESGSLNSQLEAAALVAKIFGAHIDGTTPKWIVSIAHMASDLGSYPIVAESTGFTVEDQAERAEAAEKNFRDVIDRHGIAWADPQTTKDRPTANWLAPAGSGDEVIAELARLYDVTVLPRPVEKSAAPSGALLEAVLFESGRPILITPPSPPMRLGEIILIAWNGSTESARAIAFARPLLERAKRVIVLSVEGGTVSGPSAGDVERALQRDGIPAEACEARADGRTAGEVILKYAVDEGADLLIKGAYTRSRLRQMIFGGTTNHILRESNLPVLMSH